MTAETNESLVMKHCAMNEIFDYIEKSRGSGKWITIAKLANLYDNRMSKWGGKQTLQDLDMKLRLNFQISSLSTSLVIGAILFSLTMILAKQF